MCVGEIGFEPFRVTWQKFWLGKNWLSFTNEQQSQDSNKLTFDQFGTWIENMGMLLDLSQLADQGIVKGETEFVDWEQVIRCDTPCERSSYPILLCWCATYLRDHSHPIS